MKRFLSALLAILLLPVLPAGCASKRQSEDDRWDVWFAVEVSELSRASGALRGVTYHGERTVPALMEALLQGPADENLSNPIPEGTRLQNWSRNGNTLQIDLTSPYDRLAGINLTLADYCITMTLTQLPGVENVHITVNGSEISYRDRQVFRRDDVVFSGAEEEPVEVYAALCFQRADSAELGVELRSFRLTESQQSTVAVLEALIAGPTDGNLMRLLPEGTEVYSARVDGGVCYADFSSALLENNQDALEEQLLIFHSIMESLCSLENVQSVQILMEGEPVFLPGMSELVKIFP